MTLVLLLPPPPPPSAGRSSALVLVTILSLEGVLGVLGKHSAPEPHPRRTVASLLLSLRLQPNECALAPGPMSHNHFFVLTLKPVPFGKYNLSEIYAFRDSIPSALQKARY